MKIMQMVNASRNASAMASKQMTLGRFIDLLRTLDKGVVVECFKGISSYRGYYKDLALLSGVTGTDGIFVCDIHQLYIR